MRAEKIKQKRALRRKRQTRRNVKSSPQRPRLLVGRTRSHTYAQIVEDGTGRTLAAVSTLQPPVRAGLKRGGNIEAAKAVGGAIAAAALERNLKTVCFDRGGRKYHGRIKALADAAREAGLQF